MTDRVNDLETQPRVSNDGLSKTHEHKEISPTQYLLMMPSRALCKRLESVVCTMADDSDTPHTVPRDLIRYVVDADTA